MEQSYIDKLLGEKGLKTDVSVSLKKDTYINLGATIIVSILIGSALGAMIKRVLSK